MAGRSEFLYWTGSLWASATYRTYSGGVWTDVSYLSANDEANPVMRVKIDEQLGNPRAGEVTLINRAKDFTSTTDHEGRGRFTGAFTDFQDVRIRDGETGVILLAGKIYDLEEKYDQTFGNLIILTIRDNLEELKNYITGNWVDKPLLYTTRISSDIATLINDTGYVGSTGISISDTDKYENSASTVSAESGQWEFKGGNNTALKTIGRLTALDPHESGNTDDFGYDYFVDPNVETRAHDTHGYAAAWNYFKRGTRPTTVPNTHGLTIKYPSADFAENGYNLRMFPDFTFSEPKGELYSDVVVTYQDSGSQTSGGVEVPDTEGDTEKVMTRRFERIDVTSISGAFSSEAASGTAANTVPFSKTEIIKFIATGGSPSNANGFARIEYQSVDSGTGFLIVSPLEPYLESGVSGADGNFNSDFPEVAGTITGLTSGVTASTGASCRPSKNFGVKKSRHLTLTDATDPRKIRDQIVSFLSRNTTVIKRGDYKVSGYPAHYIDAAAADVSRSDGTITFASTPFATNGGSATNNPQLFGVQDGDVIAELDSTASTVTRFAYISTVSSASVIYDGDTATNTSDGTALDASLPMRIYVPLRAGHVIQTTNAMANVSGIHLVTGLTYTEDNGISFTQVQSIGKNDSAVKLGQTGFEAVIEGASKHGDDNTDALTNIAKVTSWTYTGAVSATDSNTIEWAAGKFYDDSGGKVYAIGSGNTGDMTAGTDYVVYFDPTASTTAFSVTAKASYQEKKERVKVLATTAVTNHDQASFSYLTPVSGISTNNQSLTSADDSLVNNSMSAALAKKGTQNWSTNIRFKGTDYNALKWFKEFDADGDLVGDETTDGTISFADNTEATVADGTAAGLAAGKVYYYYLRVGDNANSTLVQTLDYSDVYQDDRILMATVKVPDADGTEDSPSIFPFNGNQGTVSAGIISANAIVAGAIKAGSIEADKLETNLTISNTIRTASSGARVEMTSSGMKILHTPGSTTESHFMLTDTSSNFFGMLKAQTVTYEQGSTHNTLGVYGPGGSYAKTHVASFGVDMGVSEDAEFQVRGSIELHESGEGDDPPEIYWADNAMDGEDVDYAVQGSIYVNGGKLYVKTGAGVTGSYNGSNYYSDIAADTGVSGWSGYSWYGTPTSPIFSTASTTLGADTGMAAFKYDSGGQTYLSLHSDGDISMTFGDTTAGATYQYTSAFYTKSMYPSGGGDPSTYDIGYVNTAGTTGHFVYDNIVGTSFIMTTHEGGASPTLPASGVTQSFGAIFTKRANIYAHGEVWAKDASGNITQLSPHDENGKWIFHAHNEKTGKTLKIQMEKLMRKLNDEFGGDFIEECTEEL